MPTNTHLPGMTFPSSPKVLNLLIRNALLCSSFYLFTSTQGFAQDYFNPALLGVGNTSVSGAEIADLSHFESGSQAPGIYRVSIFLNDVFVEDKDVTFYLDEKNTLLPVFTLADFENLGLRSGAVPGLSKLASETQIKDIRHEIPSAQLDFQFAQQRLNVSLPQMLVKRRPQGEVNPASWDQGLTAAMLNYTLSGNQTRYHNQASRDAIYANLRGGLNFGAWRLRSYGIWQQTSNDQRRSQDFNLISTYLQRDIHALKGQLTLGDSATSAEVFDSVQFQGGQLASDDGMLPDSMRGFAPVIRGVAESGGEVTVRQNGNVIYQTYVPPGPFEIDDLYPASLSGDLVVTIKEADGSERTFTQPYSSIAVMQREGQLKYAVTIGKLRNSSGDLKQGAAQFVQGTLIYGLPGSITVYGGLQLAKQYLGASVGVGLGLGKLGALSADITHSDATLPNGDTSQGQSYRLRYSRSAVETGTTLSLAAYRYSTEGYYNLQDAFTNPATGGMNSQYRPRGEFQVMLNQSLGDLGALYVSGSQRDYWAKAGELRTWSLGYSTNAYGVNYGLNLSQSRDTDSGKQDHRLALNVSVPLSRWLAGDSRNSMQANYGISSSNNHPASQQLGLSGTALNDNQLQYNLSQSLNEKSSENVTSLSGSYRSSAGTLSAGYNRSNLQQQVNLGLRGGILAHPYGVTLSQDMGESVALVRAPGASNIKVNNQTGLYTDGRGYAVMPWLTPYRRTEISLNPQGLASNVTMNNTSTAVTPTRGAVVLADLPTQRGHQAMITLRKADGEFVPFGATARLLQSEQQQPTTSIVGDEGLLYISGLPDKGSLEVMWGKGSDANCHVSFDLTSASVNALEGVPLQVASVCQRPQ